MPPKPPVKRLTKKEKRELALKLKQEEEEKRRLQEEEERRQREEEEERIRKEEQKLAKEEEERLKEENKENTDFVTKLKKQKIVADQENKIQEEWNKFMLNHEIADPEREAEITTFITQYREHPLVENLEIQDALDLIQKSEELVQEVEGLYLKQISVGNYDKSAQYQQFIQQTRDITEQKLEECTSDLVKNSEKMTDEKEKEVKKQQEDNQKQVSKNQQKNFEVYNIYKLNKDVRYGLWINPNQKGGFRHKPIDFGETKLAMEIPSKLIHQAFIMKACWTSFDNFSNPNKYYKYRIIGGVVDIECIERPPLQIKSSNWGLKYDFDVKDSIKKLTNGAEGQGAQPVKIIYQLPDYLKIYKGKRKPQIAVYDENTQEWRRDLISEISEIDEERIITFKTPKIAPCAMIQDRCTDYPYQKFFMRAVDDSKILIDIKGRRDTFKFQIGPGYALLIANPEIPEFNGFQGKKLPVGKLLNDLARSGVNLLPIREDALTATLTPKNAITEELAIKDVCQAIRSFMVRSSPFSFQLHEDKILCRLRENEEYDEQTFNEDQEKDWKSICWYPNKCAILRCGDLEEYPDERFKEDTFAHINLEYLLKKHNLTQEFALQRMKETEHLIIQDTLSQFLQLTHLLTFTIFESDKPYEEEEEEELVQNQLEEIQVEEQEQLNPNGEQQNTEQNGENGENQEGEQQQQNQEQGQEEAQKQEGEQQQQNDQNNSEQKQPTQPEQEQNN